MPTTTVHQPISAQQAADALEKKLGNGYKVKWRGSGPLTVSRGGLAFASVRLVQGESATTFHVHGGGLIIGRFINEFGIARTVNTAITDAFASDRAAS